MAFSFYHGAVQALCLLICAPLIAGIVNKTKAFLQKRQGASIFQEYFDLWKWWRKPIIVTKYTSWVFLAAPIIYLVTSIMAAMMLPGLLQGNIRFGDAFVFVYVLALGRFFMTLGSLDSATAFGGMGGSREIYISVLVEPAVMLAVLLNASRYGSTMLSQMVIDYNAFYFTVPAVLGSVAFFLVMLAENSRLPVTMIHECMTLEYSGRLLSYIHLGSMLKMLSFFVLFGALYLPLPLPMVVKVLMTALLVDLVEILNNKMRLFKVRVYLAAAVIMLAVAIIAQ